MIANVQGERCELCGAPLENPHRHVEDLTHRVRCCACRGCAKIYERPYEGAHHRTIVDRVLIDPSFRVDPATWRALHPPGPVAFLQRRLGATQSVALFPTDAGVEERPLTPELVALSGPNARLLAEATPDVEGVLVRFFPSDDAGAILVSIDVFDRLAELIRRSWPRADGKEKLHARLDSFFRSLLERASRIGDA